MPSSPNLALERSSRALAALLFFALAAVRAMATALSTFIWLMLAAYSFFLVSASAFIFSISAARSLLPSLAFFNASSCLVISPLSSFACLSSSFFVLNWVFVTKFFPWSSKILLTWSSVSPKAFNSSFVMSETSRFALFSRATPRVSGPLLFRLGC